MAVTACPYPDCGHRLEGLARYCHSCLRYPDDFRADKPKAAVSDTRSEAEIQQATKKAVELLGFSYWDLSQPRATMQTEGLPDLFVMGRGLTCWIELKSARGKQTDAQQRFQKGVESNGGLYILARHEGEVVEILTGLCALGAR